MVCVFVVVYWLATYLCRVNLPKLMFVGGHRPYNPEPVIYPHFEEFEVSGLHVTVVHTPPEKRTRHELHSESVHGQKHLFYCHGNDGDLSRWLNVVTSGTRLYQHVDTVCLWDYRGYGRSAGKLDSMDSCWSDLRHDVAQVYRWFVKHVDLQAVDKMYLYGRSLGAWTTAALFYQLELHETRSLERILLETPLCHLHHTLHHAVSSYLPQSWLQRVAPFPEEESVQYLLYTSQNRLEADVVPVSIISAGQDDLVPTDDVNQLQKHNWCTLLQLDRCHHNNVNQTHVYQVWLQHALSLKRSKTQQDLSCQKF